MITISCDYCQKPIHVEPRRFEKQKKHFCNAICMGLERNKKVSIHCVVCNSVFQVSPSRVHQYATCSSKCKGLHLKQEQIRIRNSQHMRIVTCFWCGKSFERKPSQVTKYPTSYCSNMCKYQGIRQKQHTNKEYGPGFTRTLKTKIRVRDNYTCQKCFRSDKRVLIHHIDGTKHNHAIDNLVCLCDLCHQQVHHGIITYP